MTSDPLVALILRMGAEPLLAAEPGRVVAVSQTEAVVLASVIADLLEERGDPRAKEVRYAASPSHRGYPIVETVRRLLTRLCPSCRLRAILGPVLPCGTIVPADKVLPCGECGGRGWVLRAPQGDR